MTPILTSELLPQVGHRVLFFCTAKHVDGGWWELGEVRYSFTSLMWYAGNNNLWECEETYSLEDVTHWTELPPTPVT